jgi:hypothetical protein
VRPQALQKAEAGKPSNSASVHAYRHGRGMDARTCDRVFMTCKRALTTGVAALVPPAKNFGLLPKALNLLKACTTSNCDESGSHRIPESASVEDTFRLAGTITLTTIGAPSLLMKPPTLRPLISREVLLPSFPSLRCIVFGAKVLSYQFQRRTDENKVLQPNQRGPISRLYRMQTV